jgi:hypothetical protein
MITPKDLTNRVGPPIHDSLGGAPEPPVPPPHRNGHGLAARLAQAALLGRERGIWPGCTQCFASGRDMALRLLDGVQTATLADRLARIRALGPADQPSPHAWTSFAAGRDAVLAVMEADGPS